MSAPKFNCKDITIPTKKQISIILKVMKEAKLGYDCTLFDVTSNLYNEEDYLASRFTISSLISYRLNTIDKVQSTLDYIKKNRLLDSE